MKIYYFLNIYVDMYAGVCSPAAMQTRATRHRGISRRWSSSCCRFSRDSRDPFMFRDARIPISRRRFEKWDNLGETNGRYREITTAKV